MLRVDYEFAASSHLWTANIGQGGPSFRIENKEIADFQPTSVWMRRWGFPIYPSSFDEVSTMLAFSELSSLLSGLPHLDDCFWLNRPDREKIASNKVLQLTTAQSIGFVVPPTVITNSALEALAFSKNVGRTIFKAVSASQVPLRRFNQAAFNALSPTERSKFDFGFKYETEYMYTRELTEDMTGSLYETLRWSPAIFQKRIEKRSDIRVTVVGRKIFACSIDSQSREDTKTDFRFMNVSGLLPHVAVELGDRVNDMVFSLMDRLGLHFGCIDFVEDTKGDLVFLEINPSGQWLWIEQLTGIAISKAIALALVEAD